MDFRTTLAFTRPRELARLYSVCGCGLDCIFTHSCQRTLSALLRVPGAPTYAFDADRGD
nr:MAG TPA: robustoxin [Caudoviricetes sp.]